MSIKELIYDELYFASSAECNDPYEGKIFAILEKNQELWNNLIRLALKFYANDVTEYLIKRIITFYVGKAPIYFDQFVNTSEDEFLNLGNDEIEKRLEYQWWYAGHYHPSYPVTMNDITVLPIGYLTKIK